MTLKELKKEEKRLFDTYKQNRTNVDKYTHLEKMVKVIKKIDELSK